MTIVVVFLGALYHLLGALHQNIFLLFGTIIRTVADNVCVKVLLRAPLAGPSNRALLTSFSAIRHSRERSHHFARFQGDHGNYPTPPAHRLRPREVDCGECFDLMLAHSDCWCT